MRSVLCSIAVVAFLSPSLAFASEHCAADLNGDGVVGPADLAMLLASWGSCPDSCDAGTQNQDETDIDCGGSICPPCPAGSGCIAGTDCQSGVCSRGECQACDPEVCDGLDNDCDGDIDEDNPDGGAPCDGADSDACEEGIILCIAGMLICDDTTDDSVEVCDGIDNDCNGMVDENTCAAGESCCTGTCVDTSTDPFNCGACGVLCPAGESCVAGNCQP